VSSQLIPEAPHIPIRDVTSRKHGELFTQHVEFCFAFAQLGQKYLSQSARISKRTRQGNA